MCKPVLFRGNPIYDIISTLLLQIWFNFIFHVPLRKCLISDALFSLYYLLQFRQVISSETSVETIAFYLLCIKLNPGVFH